MRELLLGYLLGALDDDEQRQIEQQIERDPRWREELAALQARLEPLAESYADFEPPQGLAQRTCAVVAARAEESRVRPAAVGLAAAHETGAKRTYLTVPDLVVTAAILLAAVLLFFPAISNSREAARAAHCQNNLRQLGLALASYSDTAGCGYFPWVASSGNRAFAGIVGPTLVDSGHLTEPAHLICPASSLAEQQEVFRVPSLSEVDRAQPAAILVIRQYAGGSYGYNLGVMVGGKHLAPRNLARAHFALMADAPSVFWTDHRSVNHGSRGQNVLFEDGHIRFLVLDVLQSPWLDHPFLNRRGMVEVGLDGEDAVIAPSSTPPFADPPPPPLTGNF